MAEQPHRWWRDFFVNGVLASLLATVIIWAAAPLWHLGTKPAINSSAGVARPNSGQQFTPPVNPQPAVDTAPASHHGERPSNGGGAGAGSGAADPAEEGAKQPVTVVGPPPTAPKPQHFPTPFLGFVSSTGLKVKVVDGTLTEMERGFLHIRLKSEAHAQETNSDDFVPDVIMKFSLSTTFEPRPACQMEQVVVATITADVTGSPAAGRMGTPRPANGEACIDGEKSDAIRTAVARAIDAIKIEN